MFAGMVAKKLKIPFHQVDLSVPYRQRVVDYMFAEYEKGRTPNPDVLCNREIKFDSFAVEARKLKGDFVATGHYCRKEEISSGNKIIYRLLAGKDHNKDQSYFLCQVDQEQLRPHFSRLVILPNLKYVKLPGSLDLQLHTGKIHREYVLLEKFISLLSCNRSWKLKKEVSLK